jgi:hypothetical protein
MKPPSENLEPKPDLSVLSSIFTKVYSLRESTLKSTDPKICQSSIRALDKTLRDLASAQNEIGQIRKQIGLHLRKLQEAKPKKVKPIEGSVKDANGKSYIFLDNLWQPYKGEP